MTALRCILAFAGTEILLTLLIVSACRLAARTDAVLRGEIDDAEN
jgi:hypothetical protein